MNHPEGSKRMIYTPLLLVSAMLLLWLIFKIAPQVSGLDQLHLLTSLAYLLLLLGGTGLRTVLRTMRSVPQTQLSDSFIMLLGYSLPGLIGWLPALIFYQPFSGSLSDAYINLTAPDLLWIPATQAGALAILAPYTAPLIPTQPRPSTSISFPAALLAGLGLSLMMTFAWQLARTILFPGLATVSMSAVHWALALISAVPLAYFSERFLRGRLLPRWTQPDHRKNSSLAGYVALAGLLAVRPCAILPAALSACLFIWLANHEGGVQSSKLAHITFNLSSVFLNNQFIH